MWYMYRFHVNDEVIALKYIVYMNSLLYPCVYRLHVNDEVITGTSCTPIAYCIIVCLLSAIDY